MSTAPTESPRFLGRYELVHPLGQGGMGEVYLAKISGAAGFEKPCIVKTILPGLLKDRQFLDRFHHEAKVLVHLVHSSIAQVYDMGEADGTYYMALEYVAGVDLAYLLEQARAQGQAVPVPVALYIGQKMAEGLGYAHRKAGPDGVSLGIVHRDVSPHNAMVSYEGEVKVIDFGLAKSAARSKYTLPATVMGKLGYMSPEQVRAEPLDHRSDIYSCGVVVWEMLAGRSLIPHGTVGEMMAAMSHPQVPSLAELRPDVDAALDAVVRRALTASPAERYSRADDFARALNGELLRSGSAMGAEEVGQFVRALCPEAFAAQRKLISKVSSSPGIRRTPTPGGGKYGTGPFGSPEEGSEEDALTGSEPTVMRHVDDVSASQRRGSGGVAPRGEAADEDATSATAVRSGTKAGSGGQPSAVRARTSRPVAPVQAPIQLTTPADEALEEAPAPEARRRSMGPVIALAAVLLVGATAGLTAFFVKRGTPVAPVTPGTVAPVPGTPGAVAQAPGTPGTVAQAPGSVGTPGTTAPTSDPVAQAQGTPDSGTSGAVAQASDAPGETVAANPPAQGDTTGQTPEPDESDKPGTSPTSGSTQPAVASGSTTSPTVKPVSVSRPKKTPTYIAAKTVAEVKSARGGGFTIDAELCPSITEGTSLQVVGPAAKGKNGKRPLLGKATVESLHPKRVKLRLDDEAYAATEDRFVVLPDPPPEEKKPEPVATAPVEPEKPTEPPRLQGYVMEESLGGLLNRKIVVYNASDARWNDCKVIRMKRESARLPAVPASRKAGVSFGDFKPDADAPYFREENKIIVRCKEGEGEFFLSRG